MRPWWPIDLEAARRRWRGLSGGWPGGTRLCQDRAMLPRLINLPSSAEDVDHAVHVLISAGRRA
jgi:hypothetical protein